MSEAYENGYTADLSKIKFPTCKTIDDNMNALFVYLRNTGFKVTYDFREMNYAQKEALLKAYLSTNIDFEIKELTETWLNIFYASCGCINDGIESILNELELITFCSVNADLINTYITFLASLPLFMIIRTKLDIEMDYESTDEELNLVNFYYIIKHPMSSDITLHSGVTPKNFTKYFTTDNDTLFSVVAENSGLSVILYGMLSSSEDEFLEFLKGVAECYED